MLYVLGMLVVGIICKYVIFSFGYNITILLIERSLIMSSCPGNQLPGDSRLKGSPEVDRFWRLFISIFLR